MNCKKIRNANGYQQMTLSKQVRHEDVRSLCDDAKHDEDSEMQYRLGPKRSQWR